METTLFVFLIGSAATFLPVYWLLEKGVELLGYWRRQREVNARSPEMNEFLQCLRDETASRITTELGLAIQEMKVSASIGDRRAAPLRAHRMEQLRDLRRMMEPLFSRTEIASFDEITGMLAAGDIRQLDSIAARIDDLQTRLERKRVPAADRSWLRKRRAPIALFPQKPVLASGW